MESAGQHTGAENRFFDEDGGIGRRRICQEIVCVFSLSSPNEGWGEEIVSLLKFTP